MHHITRKLLLLVCCALALTGCAAPQAADTPVDGSSLSITNAATADPESAQVTLTDCTGLALTVSKNPTCVVGLSSSLAEIWLLSGGTLAGVTDDAVSERALAVGDAAIIGSIKTPSAESILALSPDLVILSADTPSHMELTAILAKSDIPYYAAKVEQFSDYLKVLNDFTTLTGREDLYDQNGTAVQQQIDALLAKVPACDEMPTVLYLRAYSSGVKVKARDNVACDILLEVGAVNVADGNAALEELSMEAIVESDPDYIFVATMGDEQEALQALDRMLCQNPAWDTLTAVENGHFYVLPKDLFHYKPNARWAESYSYLLSILWPEVYGAA